MVRFQFLIHQRFELIGVFCAERNHAQVVAHEFHCVMVFGEAGELGEDRGLAGLFDMGFQRKIALALGEFEKRVLEAEQFEIGVLAVARAASERGKGRAHGFQHRAGVADHEGADRSAQNDDEFEGLEQHFEMGAHGGITAEDATNHYQKPNDQPHCPNASIIDATPRPLRAGRCHRGSYWALGY